ncbi:hypothetical protein V9T40_001712 [Parthenolecanium corni]|uniref:Coiled-coil and C2 domain-containing protein 2A n=1 Tax=Parthenolecanium corni TaxID=536013 RepID=A0AAN9TIZ2_9HEMI
MQHNIDKDDRIEGTFQLYSPPFLFGYDRQPSLASSDHSHLRNSTFLTLFIIVQPPLSPPDPIMEHLECSEPLHLEQHLELWSKEVSKYFPHRCVKTLVTDVGGKSVCVTRFFRSINPPTIYEGETTSPEMIARYVSLIPVSTSGTLLFGHFNVWLTCDQTIRLLLGEREDHAILLCCFLMKLGLKVWLLFGSGIPHGRSAYVLTRDDTSLATPTYTIWDPVTGLSYSSMDSFSPLHKVYCLINDENIWVNVQSEELVRRTNFDVTQRSNWWPAFGRSVSAPSTSVQPDDIEYAITSPADVQLLQDKIEKYLKDSIMKWRPTSRTIWNRYCIATLRKLLPIMEREACGLKQPSNSDHLNELQHIFGSHKMCGFPISQPFTNIKAIIEAVKSTGVHNNESPDVEFALAVYVHPYPNDVLSVWVYAVSLVAQR